MVLRGAFAIVTGSSEGLGRGVAEAFVDEGAVVVISARRPELLAATAAELEARGGRVAYLAADFGATDTPERLVTLALERFGRLDAVVANAGGPPPRRALEVDDQGILDAVNNNFLSAVRLTLAALPHFRAQQWGRICAIASNSVVQPIPGIALSNTARSALRAWAKTAAHDLQGSGITLNLVCPGRHRTARQLALGHTLADEPDPLSGEPSDFGRVVRVLLFGVGQVLERLDDRRRWWRNARALMRSAGRSEPSSARKSRRPLDQGDTDRAAVATPARAKSKSAGSTSQDRNGGAPGNGTAWDSAPPEDLAQPEDRARPQHPAAHRHVMPHLGPARDLRPTQH